MDLRNADNIILEQAIIHVIDISQDEAVLSLREIDMSDEDVYMFLKNHIFKALKDDKCFKAKIIHTSAALSHIESILDSDSVVEESFYFADKFFKIQKSEESNSGDFIVARFRVGELKAVAIAVMDFKTGYIHEINFDNGELTVKLSSQQTALPNISQRLSKAGFFWKDKNNEIQAVCLDNKFEKEESAENVFVGKLLNARKEMDYKAKTRETRKIVENWVRKNLKEDLELALNIRKAFDTTYREGVIATPCDIISSIPEIEKRESEDLKISLERGGVDSDTRFEVDKLYVESKMKKKKIITDTGFSISADFELFEGDSFIEIKQNPDGTADYIIKNVKNTKEN